MSAVASCTVYAADDEKMSRHHHQPSFVAPNIRVKRGVDPVLTSLVATGALGTIAGAGVLPLVTGHFDDVSDTLARIQEKRRRSGRPSKIQRVLKSVKKNVMSSLRKAYYGDPREKRLRARRERYEQISRQAASRSLLRFVRDRIKERLVTPMVRGVRRLVKDEAKFRTTLSGRKRGRPSSRRGQRRRPQWHRDGSISLRCYHNPRLRGCGRRAGRRPPPRRL